MSLSEELSGHLNNAIGKLDHEDGQGMEVYRLIEELVPKLRSSRTAVAVEGATKVFAPYVGEGSPTEDVAKGIEAIRTNFTEAAGHMRLGTKGSNRQSLSDSWELLRKADGVLDECHAINDSIPKDYQDILDHLKAITERLLVIEAKQEVIKGHARQVDYWGNDIATNLANYRDNVS